MHVISHVTFKLQLGNTNNLLEYSVHTVFCYKAAEYIITKQGLLGRKKI